MNYSNGTTLRTLINCSCDHFHLGSFRNYESSIQYEAFPHLPPSRLYIDRLHRAQIIGFCFCRPSSSVSIIQRTGIDVALQTGRVSSEGSRPQVLEFSGQNFGLRLELLTVSGVHSTCLSACNQRRRRFHQKRPQSCRRPVKLEPTSRTWIPARNQQTLFSVLTRGLIPGFKPARSSACLGEDHHSPGCSLMTSALSGRGRVCHSLPFITSTDQSRS